MGLFLGTLNIRLNEAFDLPKKCMLEVEEWGETVSISIVPCTTFERPAVILRTDKEEA